MGFGTLFIGYFLLFNIPYFGFTDIIAAAIMAAGLNKLSAVNQYFKSAYWISLVFTVYSLPELIFFALDLFQIYENTDVLSYLRIGQSVIICLLTVLMLKGIADVAKEVELEKIPKRAGYLIYASLAVYILWIICNAPILTNIMGGYVSLVYLAAILSALILVGVNLVTIYTCYMRICMPGDEGNNKNKKLSSRAERAREIKEERAMIDAEYNRKRMEEKAKRRHKK